MRLEKIEIVALVVWAIGALVSITFFAGAVYVAWHFAKKFW